MEHSKTQALVTEPPCILVIKKEFWKYYEKQENINHISELIWYPVLWSDQIWSDGLPCLEQEVGVETFWGPFYLNDSVIIIIISCSQVHTNNVTKGNDISLGAVCKC